jgi:hypothetical protein
VSEEREQVRIALYENEYIRGDECRPLAEAVEWLSGLLNQVPVEFRGAAVFEIEHESGYYDSGDSTNFRIYYDRPITDAEIAAREAEEEVERRQRLAEVEARERAFYEQLNRKYGKQ